jgi:hypothetical protein
MLIEHLNDLIQPHLAGHPLRLRASMVSNQEREMDAQRFLQTGAE